MRNDKAVNSPQASKEVTVCVKFLVVSLCIVVQKTFKDSASASALFLIFHQILGSCFYKTVLIKKSIQKIQYICAVATLQVFY